MIHHIEWAKNGEIAGTIGLSKRVEAIQIITTRKNEDAPEDDFRGIQSGYKEALIQADSSEDTAEEFDKSEIKVGIRAHYQTYGWQEWNFNGEAFELMGYDGMRPLYMSYGVCSEGNQFEYYENKDVYSDGIAGSVGESKPIYAIRIGFRNMGMSDQYDLYYRVYTGKYGWQGWVKDYEEAGVISWGKKEYDTRIEKIQIAVVEKDGPAPGLEYNGIVGEAGKPGCYEYH